MLITMPAPLPQTLIEAHKELVKKDAEIERLRQQLEMYRKYIYGKSSEKRPQILDSGAQLSMFEALGEANEEEATQEVSVPAHTRKKKGGRRDFPADLEREDVVHDVAPEEKVCACGCEKHRMGEDVTEQLEYVPAKLYVKRHIRPKYVCRHCSGSIVQAPPPEHPIARCLVGVALLTYMIVSKYGDHLPLYRLEQIFKRGGIDITRSNMSEWAMRLHQMCKPLIALIIKAILDSEVIASDDTRLRVQQPGGTKQCYLWNYLGDHHAPYVYYDFREGRGRDGPNKMLADFTGHLLCDAYTGYEDLFSIVCENGMPQIIEVACWAHARRYFVKAEDAGDTRAATPLELIGKLYGVEKRAKEETEKELANINNAPVAIKINIPEHRKHYYSKRLELRSRDSVPVLDELYNWIDAQLDVWPESPLGKALTYAQNQRAALHRFAADGRLEIDNNAAERAIRPIAIGRKNWLFAGSNQGGHAAATFFTLIESAKRCGVNPQEYLLDVFTRLPGASIQQLDQFLPDRWLARRKPAAQSAETD